MRPVAFIDAFQRLARSVHSKTNMTGFKIPIILTILFHLFIAMVFGPNIGITYPYVDTPAAFSSAPTAATFPEDFHSTYGLISSNESIVLLSPSFRFLC